MNIARRIAVKAALVVALGGFGLAGSAEPAIAAVTMQCDSNIYCTDSCAGGLGWIDCTNCGTWVWPQCHYDTACSLATGGALPFKLFCGYDT